jgi:uncharacterized protein (DUF342 family)
MEADIARKPKRREISMENKDLPFPFEMKLWDLESDMKSLKDANILEDEGKIFDELLANYSGLDEGLRKELQTYKALAEQTTAHEIDNLAFIDGKAEISISDDRMKVLLNLIPPEGKGKIVSTEQISSLLESQSVRFGIKHDRIQKLLAQNTIGGQVVLNECIAEGNPPQPGRDGQIDFVYEKYAAPGGADDGIPDFFKPKGSFQAVKKGQVLAKIIPSSKGIPGKDVLGSDIPASDGSPISLGAGENVATSEDDGHYIAAIDGIVERKGNVLSVKKVLVIDGDVDVASGNIEFDGSVRIKGSVHDGFSVKTKSDIHIQGGVEGATIISLEGNITVEGGIVGKGRCYISAGKDIHAKFIEKGVAYAKRSVRVSEAILHSKIVAGEEIDATRGKGTIAGGMIFAGQLVAAKKVGAPGEPRTEVKLGIDIASRQRVEQIEQELSFVRQTGAKINEVLDRVVGSSGNIKNFPEETVKRLTDLKKSLLILHYKEKRLVNVIAGLEQKATAQCKGRFSADTSVFPNVHVTIGNADFNATTEKGRTVLQYDPVKQKLIMLK